MLSLLLLLLFGAIVVVVPVPVPAPAPVAIVADVVVRVPVVVVVCCNCLLLLVQLHFVELLLFLCHFSVHQHHTFHACSYNQLDAACVFKHLVKRRDRFSYAAAFT